MKQDILNNLDISGFYKSHIPSFNANGKVEVLTNCPFHDDKSPSMSVNTDTGKYFCHACKDGGDPIKFHMRMKGVDFRQALADLSGENNVNTPKQADTSKRIIECVYPYTDEEGRLLFETVRFIPKTFRQRRPDGKGGYIWNTEGIPLVPYKLLGVINADTVYICEGEKDCNNLEKLGLIATTNPRGAGKWPKEFGRYFIDKDVVIICDNDEPGLKHGYDVASKLHGHVKSIKVVESLPGVPEKGDVSDWLGTPGNDKERLLKIIKDADVWIPGNDVVDTAKHDSVMILTRLNDLFEEPEENITWLVDGMLSAGGFSAAVAKPKVGKSTTVRVLSLCVARGASFLNRKVSQGAVIYLALEEKRSEVKKHFKDLGAAGNEDIHIYVGGAPVDAIKQIRKAIEKIKPALVIIDPLFRLTKVKDTNDYAQVTNALEPLLRLARDTGTHVMCIHHANKMSGEGGNCVLGSQAIFGSVDTLIIMKRHEEYRTIQTIQRYGEDLPETVLVFDKVTRNVSLGGNRQDEDVKVIKKVILEFLSTQTESVTESIINQGVEGSVKIKCRALRELVSENEINREGKGTRGNPFKYSTILLPDISIEVEKENPKITGNPHGCKGYSTSQDFALFQKNEKSPEVESLKKIEDKKVGIPVKRIPGNDEIPEVEFIEEIKTNV
jgi:hypothetical protein